MTRIIAGRFGGRRLRTPPGAATRPTTDRVREALFSALESATGGLDGLRVLDLFAGSGAVGLEALSRGAGEVDLVESAGPAVRVIRANVGALGADGVRVHRSAAATFLTGTSGAWDVVFADPPYAFGHADLEVVLAALRPRLAADAIVVIERSSRSAFAWPEPYSGDRRKDYGETTLWYGH